MRNTICATLTAITLTLCVALAGCGSASKTSTPAHAIAATGATCSEESDDGIKECIVTLSKVASEVCADCMWRLKFQPVRTISLDVYRLFEQWLDRQKEEQ